MDSPMKPVDTSTNLGEWVMPNLTYQQTYQQETVLLGFSAIYQQGIKRFDSPYSLLSLEVN